MIFFPLKNNKILLFLILLYTVLEMSIVSWGVPNETHPFTYHMDEWHQLMAVRGVFTHGSANIPGAAHGTVFQFFLSGIYLIPFYVFHIVNPFTIKDSLSELLVQQRLFEILRINTLLFGIGSIVVFWKMIQRFFSFSPVIPTFFFTFNPLFLMLSNYFKYDIAMLFWIVLSVYFVLSYGEKPTLQRYILGSFAIGFALATKVSAAPLLPLYVFSYGLFTPKKKWNMVFFLKGVAVVGIIFLVFGIPDIFFRYRDYIDHLFINLISVPSTSGTYTLGIAWWQYLFLYIYPITFGHGFFITAVLGLFLLVKRGNEDKQFLIVIFGFLFFSLSILPLQLFAAGNRSLVLLPFLALFAGYFFQQCLKRFKKYQSIIVPIIIIFVGIQFYESHVWIRIKQQPDPRSTSSEWIMQHMQKQTIGIENIPIYQFLPDIILKEYYLLEKNKYANTHFSYQVIDTTTKNLPKTIVVTNVILGSDYVNDSPKKRLVERLKKEGYKKTVVFKPSLSSYSFFGSEKDFAFSLLVPSPPIVVYEK